MQWNGQHMSPAVLLIFVIGWQVVRTQVDGSEAEETAMREHIESCYSNN